ncbi:hypothetical protein P8452_07623 [Trifolium repens]|nr:hypothetical protein P8452_07623 [Trifolium repens]
MDLHLFQKHNCNRIHNSFSSIHNCNHNSPIQSATPRFAFRIASRFTIAIAALSFNIAIPYFTIASLQFGVGRENVDDTAGVAQIVASNAPCDTGAIVNI